MSAPPPPSRNGNPKREDPNSKRARNAEFEARAAASDRSVERRVSNSGAVPHTAISASAGSGKTFQLAHRYIRLLALDVPPGRICALTFTRKAAGEIFDNIVRYLREAAAEERPRRRTAGLIGLPALTRADFLRLLRGFVDGLPQARIGTLDSFTVGVLRAFPLELGLPPAFQIMDSGGPAADRLLREVLAHVFTPRRVPASAQRAFLEAYKQATFGREEKGLCGPIADFIARHRDDYLTCPAAGVWGVPERIWPNGLPWAFDADREAHARDLDRRLAAKGWPARALGAFREVACAAGEFDKTRPWADAFSGTVAGRLFDALPALARGRVEIDYSRKTYPLDAAEAGLFHALLTHVLAVELHRALRQTAGIHAVLDQFEQHYRARQRRTGELTFTDAQHLLAPGGPGTGRLSRQAGGDDRLYIDYRLNCRLDHWLLDEFQDTSDLQWAVLANLIDEVLQDPDGTRSFFYVGDVKQAIYGWRGGNAALFREILDRYPFIAEEPLTESFRSCPAVIETVNRVFGHLPDDGLHAASLRRWRGLWRPHTSAEHLHGLAGCACLLEAEPAEAGGKAGTEDIHRLAAGIVRDLDPVRRGLDVALLVRTNDAGSRLVDVLRRECPGIRVVLEGEAAVRDNPAVELLRSLLVFALHPGDTFAGRHLRMSALRDALDRLEPDPDALPVALLRQAYAEGLARFFAHWIRALDDAAPLTAFERQRLEPLVRAAGAFDDEGEDDLDAFVEVLDGLGMADTGGRGTVRVMTIHKAKGLGFDVVILPELMGKALTTTGDLGLAIAREPATRRPEWALSMPRLDVADRDPVLHREAEAIRDGVCFEALCLLYVALTRAKRAVYMLAGPEGEAMNPALLLRRTLVGPQPRPPKPAVFGGVSAGLHFLEGDLPWHAEARPPAPAPAPARPAWPARFPGQPAERRPLARLEPSAQPGAAMPAAVLFRDDARTVADLGTAVHELFQRLEWSDRSDTSDGSDVSDPEAVMAAWTAQTDAALDLQREAAAHFRRALEAPAVREALRRPPGRCRLWRELRFEVVLGEDWVSGVFDRVVVREDADGRPQSAEILDFKTGDLVGDDRLARKAEEYAGQMRLYRRSLARMLALSPAAIRLRLVFTSPRAIIDVA